MRLILLFTSILILSRLAHAQDLYVDEVLPQIQADIIPNVEYPVSLNFKNRFDVKAGTLFLGDVLSSCEGLDNICQIISHLELDKSPELGKTKRYEHNLIIKNIIQNYPSIKLKKSHNGYTVVHSKFIYLDKDLLKNTIERLFQSMSDSKTKFNLYSFRIERPVKSRTKDLIFKIDKNLDLDRLDKSFKRNKSAVLPIIGMADDGLSDDVKISVKAYYEMKKRIPVAIKEVRRGQKILSDNFEYKWMKITEDYVEDISSLDGKQAKRRILVGRSVRKRDLQRQILVKRGKVREIDISTQGIKIVTPARMLDNGSEGEIVRVKVMKTKKILNGKVHGNGKVEVIL